MKTSKRATWSTESQAIINRFGRPVLYFPLLAQAFKTISRETPVAVTAAIVLSQSLYWTGRSTRHQDSWFEKSDMDFAHELGLGKKSLRNAVETLLGLQLLERRIESHKDGRVTLYRVNHGQVAEWMLKHGIGQSPLIDMAPSLEPPDDGDIGRKDDSAKRTIPPVRNALSPGAKRTALIEDESKKKFDDDDERREQFFELCGNGPTGYGIDEPTLGTLIAALLASSATVEAARDVCKNATEKWVFGLNGGSKVHSVKGLIVAKLRHLAKECTTPL